MRMDKWWLLFLLPIIVATNPNNENSLAIKCCRINQQLHEDLPICQELPSITNSLNLPSYLLFPATMDNRNITSRTNDRQVFDDQKWLPKELRVNRDRKGEIVYGWEPNCTVRRTLRLETSRRGQDFNWLKNGSLAVRFPTAHNGTVEQVFLPHEFCVDVFADARGLRWHAALLCPCDRVRCVKKCCPRGEALFCDSDNVCDCKEREEGAWTPFHPSLPLAETDFAYEVVIDRNITCDASNEPLIDTYPGYPTFLLHRFWNELLRDDNTCGDVVVNFVSTPSPGLIRCNQRVPFPAAEDLADGLHVPEALFLALSVATTLLVRRRRVSAYSYVHDMALVWHGASLLARSLLWTVYLKAWWLCSPIPIFIYFFSVAASFWLNVLCINMTCGFWKPLGLHHSLFKGGRAMLLLYSLFAWGATAAMTALTAVMWYSRHVPRGLLRPTLHETKTCFREDEGDGKIATFAYYYGPMGGLLGVNALLFSSIALRVRQLRENKHVLDNKTSKGKRSFNTDRSVVIYIKLMWLMGVMEMAVEMAAWVSNSNEYYFWLATSFLDVLRAAAIFYLCCCKWRTLTALRDRLFPCAALRRWRGERSVEETELPSTRGKFCKSGSDISLRTDVTVCEMSSSNQINGEVEV